jgi:hypothetical protein
MYTYTYRKRKYFIQPCIEEDIPEHFEQVRASHPISAASSCPRHMRTAIKNNMAIKVVDEDGNTVSAFYYKTAPSLITPVIAFHKRIAGFIVLVWHGYHHMVKRNTIIQYIPAKEYPSYHVLAENYSIIGFHNFRKPLVIKKGSTKLKRILNLYR